MIEATERGNLEPDQRPGFAFLRNSKQSRLSQLDVANNHVRDQINTVLNWGLTESFDCGKPKTFACAGPEAVLFEHLGRSKLYPD